MMSVHGGGHASEEEGRHAFREYRVHLYDDFVAPVRLPVDAVESLRRDVKVFASALRECTTGSGQWVNPMLGRSTRYQLTMGQAGCALELYSLQTWQYTCRLSASDRASLATAIDDRAETDGVLGDYSVAEKSILFDQGICESKKL